MKRAIKWICINGAMAVAAWYGVLEGVQGAANVVLFMTWLTFALSLFTLSDDVVLAMREKLEASSVPRWLSAGYDSAFMALLVWHGWWWTSVAMFLSILLSEVARDKAKKLPPAEAAAA